MNSTMRNVIQKDDNDVTNIQRKKIKLFTKMWIFEFWKLVILLLKKIGSIHDHDYKINAYYVTLFW